jgi:hypothetical protein
VYFLCSFCVIEHRKYTDTAHKKHRYSNEGYNKTLNKVCLIFMEGQDKRGMAGARGQLSPGEIKSKID